MDFGGVVHRLSFTVLDVDCPLVLGMPFLRDCNPQINWKTRVVSFLGGAAADSSPSNLFSGLDPEVPLAPVDCSGVAPGASVPGPGRPGTSGLASFTGSGVAPVAPLPGPGVPG